MYYRKPDPTADITCCCLGSIFAAIGALIGGIVAIFTKQSEKPRLPDKIEPGAKFDDSANQQSMAWAGLLIILGITMMILCFGPLLFGFLMAFATPDSFHIEETTGAVLLCASFFGFLIVIVGIFVYVAGRSNEYWRDDKEASQSQKKETKNDKIEVFGSAPRVYTITLPKASKWKPDVAWRFIEHLVETIPRLALRIVAENNQITWEILDWRTDANPEMILQEIYSYYPDADVDYSNYSICDPDRYPFCRFTMFFKQTEDFVWPIKYAGDLKDFDPLVSITQAMSGLQPGDRIIYTLYLSVKAGYSYKEGEKMITKSRISPLQFKSMDGTALAVMGTATGQTRDEKYREIDQKIARAKLKSPLYQSMFSIGSLSGYLTTLWYTIDSNEHIKSILSIMKMKIEKLVPLELLFLGCKDKDQVMNGSQPD